MLLFVLDAMTGAGWNQESEAATVCSACPVRRDRSKARAFNSGRTHGDATSSAWNQQERLLPHPVLSSEDEFADYETWDKGNLAGTVAKEQWMLKYDTDCKV